MKTLMERMEKKMLMATLWLSMLIDDIKSDEKGDTNFVSIMIIIVIVLAVAVIFRNQLIAIVTSVMDRLMEFVDG